MPKPYSGWKEREDKLKDFWAFACERQAVFHRRFILKQKPPWTKNPTLQTHFFTNVYRELDRGTLYLLEHLAFWKGIKAKPVDVIFNIFIYRLFNHMPTYDFLMHDQEGEPIPCGGWVWKTAAKNLKAWKADGNQVFTSAFTVTGVRFGGFDEKIDNICWLIEDLQDALINRGLGKDLVNAPTMEDLFDYLRNTYGFGKFLAYEITIDINYFMKKFSEDDFVNPGPGCKRGINLIFPDAGTTDDYVRVMRWLRKNQKAFFKRYGLVMEFYRKRELSLRNIEHSLCEYQKYVKRRSGKRGGRARKFAPQLKRPLPYKI